MGKNGKYSCASSHTFCIFPKSHKTRDVSSFARSEMFIAFLFVFGSRMVFNRLFSIKLIRFLTPDKLLGDFLHEMTVCNAQRSLTTPSALNLPLPHLGASPPAMRGDVRCLVGCVGLAGQNAARCF